MVQGVTYSVFAPAGGTITYCSPLLENAVHRSLGRTMGRVRWMLGSLLGAESSRATTLWHKTLKMFTPLTLETSNRTAAAQTPADPSATGNDFVWAADTVDMWYTSPMLTIM
ncbi:unnamed protein product [Arctogadus glacialis]